MGLWRVREKNTKYTSKEKILDQMSELRPLPQGRKEFDEWSDRIIAGALLKCEPGKEDDFIQSQKFALADMILHLGPSEDHKDDAHFIHYLRKVAVNQVADAIRQEIRAAMKAKLAEEEAKKVKLEVVPNPTTTNEKPQILANGEVQGA